MPFLMENRSTDGTDTGLEFIGDGGGKQLTIYGTSLGGGTIAIETSADDGTIWVPVTFSGSPSAFTAFAAYFIRRIAQGVKWRAVLSGSSGASNVNVIINN